METWPGPVGPTRSLLTPMSPAAPSGPLLFGVESRRSVSGVACSSLMPATPRGPRRRLALPAVRLGGLGGGVLAVLRASSGVSSSSTRRVLVRRQVGDRGLASSGSASTASTPPGLGSPGSIWGSGMGPRSLLIGAPRGRWCGRVKPKVVYAVVVPVRSMLQHRVLVRHHGVGQRGRAGTTAGRRPCRARRSRGSPDQERAVKKKSIRSSIGSPLRVRCIAVTNVRSRSPTPISSRASRCAASYAVSPLSTCPAAAAAQWSSM